MARCNTPDAQAMAISIYEMAHSKTNRTGAVRAQDQKPILGKAAEALADWLVASGCRSSLEIKP